MRRTRQLNAPGAQRQWSAWSARRCPSWRSIIATLVPLSSAHREQIKSTCHQVGDDTVAQRVGRDVEKSGSGGSDLDGLLPDALVPCLAVLLEKMGAVAGVFSHRFPTKVAVPDGNLILRSLPAFSWPMSRFTLEAERARMIGSSLLSRFTLTGVSAIALRQFSTRVLDSLRRSMLANTGSL